jgi:hypothetical protein
VFDWALVDCVCPTQAPTQPRRRLVRSVAAGRRRAEAENEREDAGWGQWGWGCRILRVSASVLLVSKFGPVRLEGFGCEKRAGGETKGKNIFHTLNIIFLRVLLGANQFLTI